MKNLTIALSLLFAATGAAACDDDHDHPHGDDTHMHEGDMPAHEGDHMHEDDDLPPPAEPDSEEVLDESDEDEPALPPPAE